jgi:hypothetical protein
MGLTIRQSTARTVIVGPILDADGVAVTDASVGDLKIAKNGASPAALNGSATLTHRNTGHYSLALTTSDTDTVGQAEIVIDDSTNAMPPKELTIIEEAIYDALFAASATGLLPANVTQFGGSNGTFSGGRPEVNASHIAGSSVSTSAAQIGVNVVNAGGTAWATVLTNLVTSIWSAVTDSSGVTTLLSRLSATRAGYLDNLSAGAVALEASLQSLITTVGASAAGVATAVWSAATRLLTAGTNIVLAKGTGVTGFTDLDAGGVRTAVGLASANLDTQLASIASDAGAAKTAAEAAQAVTDNLPDGGALTSLAQASDLAAVKTVADKLDDTLEDNAGTYRFTDDALAEAPTGGSAPTASEIADAVWDEDLTGHTTPDSAGDTLGNVATGTPPTAAAIADAVLDEALSGHTTAGTLGKAVADTLTDAAAILDDTGTSGVVVAAGSKTGFALTSAYDAAKTAAQAGDEMDLVDAPNATAIAAIQDGLSTQASVDDLPTTAELATALAGADDAVLAAIAALHNLSASDVRTAIGLASANLDTQLGTIAGYLDTEIASIISTLSTIGTAVTAIQAKSDNLPSDPADQSAVEAAIASTQSTITAAIDALNDLSAAAAAAGILDAADGIETGLTLRQAMRLVTAASAGKVSGAATSTVTIRNVGDTKDRVVATVDESGNRTAVTTDVS